jgi:Transposase DDE domain group 1
VQATNSRSRFEVVADGQGICSHVGAALLGELADRLGLTSELGRRANRGVRGGAHDRGQVLRDLVVMLADGGDALSDLAALRDQPELFGQVCSTATAWRVLAEELPADPRGIAGLWSALARVREHAWQLGATPAGPLTLDLDATLVDAHSDKQGAAGTYKGGFGFHPLGCWLDRGDGTGEALAAILRPGNAAANTAQDHLDVLAMALLALPKHARDQPILVRCDSAGATHAFTDELVRRNLAFSIGFDCDQRVQAAVLALPEQAWQPALGPRRPPPPGRLGRRAGRPGPCQRRLARGRPRDLLPRAAPPRRAAQAGLHRPGGPPLPGLHHQPARPRPRRLRGPPSSPRPRGRPHPHRQGHRPAEPALLEL